jgi:hypothetical protein
MMHGTEEVLPGEVWLSILGWLVPEAFPGSCFFHIPTHLGLGAALGYGPRTKSHFIP